MSWGRGVNNNTAGALRMPSVAQFAEQRTQKAESKGDDAVSLTVLVQESKERNTSLVYISDDSGDTTCSLILDALTKDGRAYVYTHDYPHFLLRVCTKPETPAGTLLVSDIQAVNNHLCTKEPYVWRLYRTWADESHLADLTLEVRHRFPAREAPVVIEAAALEAACAKLLFGHIVTLNEIFLVHHDGLELVCRVVEVAPEKGESEEDDDDDGLTVPDHFRGAPCVVQSAYRN